MPTKYAVRMALRIECSPAVQEVPGWIPDWDATFSDALCRGCRWPWSSPYIVVTPTWCAIITQRHAFGRISTHTLHATKSHSATIPYRDLGGSCSSTRIATYYAIQKALCIGVRLQCKRSWVRFPAETQHAQKPLHSVHTSHVCFWRRWHTE
jgi:hypothetical protein